MFGTNKRIGQALFNQVEAVGKIKLTSNFLTLQGEGPKMGQRAVFQRFTHCNLACSFCDAYFDDGEWLTLEEMKEAAINEVIKDDGQILQSRFMTDKFDCGLVLTGGEPMLQKNIVPYIEMMQEHFKWVQIETNGTVWQPVPMDTIIVCSPKCNEKAGKPTKYLEPRKEILDKADCLKFVVCADPDSPYAFVPDWAIEWMHTTGRPVYVSPMNEYRELPVRTKDKSIEARSTVDEVVSFWTDNLFDMPANQRNHEYAARLAIKFGFTLNLQMHIYCSLA